MANILLNGAVKLKFSTDSTELRSYIWCACNEKFNFYLVFNESFVVVTIVLSFLI